jgi:hypothetical protein
MAPTGQGRGRAALRLLLTRNLWVVWWANKHSIGCHPAQYKVVDSSSKHQPCSWSASRYDKQHRPLRSAAGANKSSHPKALPRPCPASAQVQVARRLATWFSCLTCSCCSCCPVQLPAGRRCCLLLVSACSDLAVPATGSISFVGLLVCVV